MDTFSTMSYGAEWRTLAGRVPGGPDQVMRDVDTVYTTEVPAMTGWVFGAAQAAKITQPIVYVTAAVRTAARSPKSKCGFPASNRSSCRTSRTRC